MEEVRSAWLPHPYYTAVFLIGMFPAAYGILVLAGRTFIFIDTIFLIGLAAAAISLAVHRYLLKSRRYRVELALVCLLGYGNVTAALFLLLNFLIHGPVYPYEAEVSFKEEEGVFSPRMEMISADSLFREYPYLVRAGEAGVGYHPGMKLHLRLARGLFGYTIILDRELR